MSSAPKHVFAESIALGAHYRYAVIDPVIVQPLAYVFAISAWLFYSDCSYSYRVDRRKSVEVLQMFLEKKNNLLELECQWLRDSNVGCVLSDAAFLGW